MSKKRDEALNEIEKIVEDRKLFAIIGVDATGVEYILQQCYEEYMMETLASINNDLNSQTYVLVYNHKCLVKSDIFGAVITREISD